MSGLQLERLLVFLRPIDCNRGKVLYKIGDKPKGIYLIQDGSFEVSVPANMVTIAESEAEGFSADAGTRYKLLKSVGQQQDRSL